MLIPYGRIANLLLFQYAVLNGTFGQELIVVHTTPPIISKFLVHAWRSCGGLHEEHSISVH